VKSSITVLIACGHWLMSLEVIISVLFVCLDCFRCSFIVSSFFVDVVIGCLCDMC